MAKPEKTPKKIPTEGLQISQDWSAVMTALALLVLVLLGVKVPW
jgi:hypothetical protein